ncbi:MAG: hypothetical protein V1750_00070, partial [Acidobacteriota bacterium]
MALLNALLVAVPHAAAAVFILLGCCLIGLALIPARWRPGSALLAALASTSVGSLAAGWLCWLAGAGLGARFVTPVFLALLLVAAPRVGALAGLLRRAGRRLWLLARANPPASLLLGALLLAATVQLLLPVVDSDGLRYHLALPKLYLLTGRVSAFDHDLNSWLPQGAEMLYLVGLRLAGGETAKFLHFAYFLLVLGSFGALLHRGRRSRPAPALAALLFAATPVALAPAPAAFTDHVALFHLAVAMVLLTRRAPGLLLGAALAGALITKLTTAPVAVLAWLAAPFALAPARRLRTLGLVALPVAIALLPIAARNVAYSGDPLFPLGHGLLGLPIPGVSAEGVRFTSHYHAQVAAPLGISWGGGQASADEVAGWHHLAGLFAVLVAIWVRPARILLLPLLAYLPVGLLFRPPTRYLLPLLWALAALEAVTLVALLRRRWAYCGALAAIPAALLAGRFVVTAFSPGELLGGALGREAYLSRVVPGYAAAAFVNRQSEGGRVMALDFPAPYYFSRPWIAEGMINDPPLLAMVRGARSGAEVADRLRAEGVCFLVVTPGFGGGTSRALLPIAGNAREARVIAELRALLRLRATIEGADVFELPPARGLAVSCAHVQARQVPPDAGRPAPRIP